MNHARKMGVELLAIGAALGFSACDGIPNPEDETANTNPPYENLDLREKKRQMEGAQQQAATQEKLGQSPQVSVRTVADITGNPSEFVGEKVVVQGDVEEVHEGHGFRLDDESPLRGGIDDDLLIMGAKDASWKVDDGWGSTKVRVEGTIRRTSGADLEKDLGWTFDPDFEEAVQGEELVLIAENVQRIRD